MKGPPIMEKMKDPPIIGKMINRHLRATGREGKKGTSSTAADRVGSQGKKGKGTAAYTVVHSRKSLATTAKWSGLSALVGVGLVLGGILVVTYRRRSAYRLLEEEASAKHPT